MGLFCGFGEVSATDMLWLRSTISDVTAMLWEQWRDSGVPNPTLEEVMLLIQMREVFIAWQMASVNAAYKLLKHALAKFLDLKSRVNVLMKLPSILDSVDMLDLDDDERDCVICLETFGEASENSPAEFPARLPCTHVVGSSCIRVWIQEAPGPLRICTLCNVSFGIRNCDALGLTYTTMFYHALNFASMLPAGDTVHEAGLDYSFGYLARRIHREVSPKQPENQSPYWIRLLKGDGSVLRVTGQHHKFHSIPSIPI